MDKAKHLIFNFLDSPLKILFWTKGELVLTVGPFLLGIVLDAFGFGIICALVCIFAIRFFKRHFGKGQLLAVMYWYLPPPSKLKYLPLSYKKEYLG